MAEVKQTAKELKAAKDKELKAQKAATKLPCGIAQDQLDNWKQQYGAENIKQIRVFDKPGDSAHFKSLVVRKPDMEAIGKASKFASEPFKAGVILYNECVLASDPDFTSNQELKASACTVLAKMFKIHESDVSDL